jgi:hypothetical protein
MTCAEVQDLIEAIAAGDVPVSGELASHLESCRTCASALEAATRIERALTELAVPSIPPHFVRNVRDAVRRDRWRYEQRVDRAFNLTVAAGIGLVVIALVGLFNLGSLAQLLVLAMETLSDVSQEPPAWPASIGAPRAAAWLTTLMVATGLVVWWWAERRHDYEKQGSRQA